MKYIVLETEMGPSISQFVPVIFPDCLVHSLVAEGIIHQHRREEAAYQVRSAGFLSVDKLGTIEIYGKSESLKKGTHVDDAELIASLFAGDAIHSLHALAEKTAPQQVEQTDLSKSMARVDNALARINSILSQMKPPPKEAPVKPVVMPPPLAIKPKVVMPVKPTMSRMRRVLKKPQGKRMA
jgi:hypothetical protein